MILCQQNFFLAGICKIIYWNIGRGLHFYRNGSLGKARVAAALPIIPHSIHIFAPTPSSLPRPTNCIFYTESLPESPLLFRSRKLTSTILRNTIISTVRNSGLSCKFFLHLLFLDLNLKLWSRLLKEELLMS